MRAKVHYNDLGEPSGFTIRLDGEDALRGKMDGSTAVITSYSPKRGEERVYAEDVHAAQKYLESLPFVQAVVLEGGE